MVLPSSVLTPFGKKDAFIDGTAYDSDRNTLPKGHTSFSWGMELALKRAGQVKSAKDVVGEGLRAATDMVFGVLPVVMGLGNTALVNTEYTTPFEIPASPFTAYLELLGVPEAVEASKP